MRFKVVGGESGKVLRGMLISAGYAVTEDGLIYDYLIAFDNSTSDLVEIDGVESPLEAKAITYISELLPDGKILLRRGGGFQSEKQIRIFIPPDNEAIRNAVEIGMYRAIITTAPIFNKEVKISGTGRGLKAWLKKKLS